MFKSFCIVAFQTRAKKEIVEHCLCCLPIGKITTGKYVFSKLNELLENKNLPWTKRVAVTTDGAAAMTAKLKKATAF